MSRWNIIAFDSIVAVASKGSSNIVGLSGCVSKRSDKVLLKHVLAISKLNFDPIASNFRIKYKRINITIGYILLDKK
jgi:hypothetical protein